MGYMQLVGTRQEPHIEKPGPSHSLLLITSKCGYEVEQGVVHSGNLNQDCNRKSLLLEGQGVRNRKNRIEASPHVLG